MTLETTRGGSVLSQDFSGNDRSRDFLGIQVGWRSDEHRRLEMLGDSGSVIRWVNGAWEVKGHEHAEFVRGVVDQFVRWYMGGVFRSRTDEADWCMHIFREHNTVADTHADWLMDIGDSGAGAR